MAININVRLGWLDGERPDDTAKELEELRKMVRHLLQGQADTKTALKEVKEMLMGLAADLADLVTKVDAATNKIADELTALRGEIKNSMTDAEVLDLKTRLGAAADRLTALGADPADPVPTGP